MFFICNICGFCLVVEYGLYVKNMPPAPRAMVAEISNAAVARFVDPHATRALTNMPNEIAATAMPMTCSVVLSILA